MGFRVLISCPHLQKTIDQYADLLAKQGIEVESPKMIQQLTEPELLKLIDRFDGVIAGDDHFTSRVLEKGVRLKVIAKWGIGLDAIDVDAAAKLGIKIFNTPDVFADEVADVVMGYIILLSRQLQKLDVSVRSGGWVQIQGRSLKGRRLGIIGMGSIGKAVVSRAKASGMEVTGYDTREIPADFIAKTGLRSIQLDELLRTSDYISLNCNLTKENHHLLGMHEFELMKSGILIVNTSRGALIDEAALLNALRSGKVVGAALDVFEKEPLPTDSPLRKFDNCIFGTHNSSNTLRGSHAGKPAGHSKSFERTWDIRRMNKIVVITGVAGGIGKATAQIFSESGWHVIGIDSITLDSVSHVDHFIRGDISMPEIWEHILEEMQAKEIRVDALINNAAIQICKPLIETTFEEWDRIMAVNLRSVYLAVRALYSLMRQAGAIVNVSSVHAVATSSNIAVYAASKGALVALTRAMSLELAADNIRVNSVLPGAVDTRMLREGLDRGHLQGEGLTEKLNLLALRTPLRRIGKPDEIAQAILFLADNDRSSFITGQTLVVDGGVTAKLSSE